MLYAKLLVAAGILLLVEGTPGPQFKQRPGFIAAEEKSLDFKDMIIKKLLFKLNEALRNRGPPGQVPPPPGQNLPPPQLQQLSQGPLIAQPPQQIITQQPFPPQQQFPPQPPIIQQHVHRKPIIQQQIPQQQQVQQLPPPQLLQQPQQVRPVMQSKDCQQFTHNCEFQQQPFGGEIQYEFEEVPCPCCQCGSHFEEIPCSFCQGVQYEEVPCPCCEQQQTFDDAPFGQRPLQFTEIQTSCNQNRPQFAPQIQPNGVAPAGLPGTHLITTRPIFKETFVSPISGCGIGTPEAKVFTEESKEPKINSPLSQAPLQQLQQPAQRIPELQQHCPQPAPQIKTIIPQIAPQGKPQRPQSQSGPLYLVPERVQLQTFIPHALHSSFFTGFSPEEETQPGERIIHETPFLSPKFKEILQGSPRDAC